MAGWIKTPRGREVGLGPSDIVLDGDPDPLLKKGAEHPTFGACLLWPNGWVDQDATRYGGRPRPRPHCARWELSSSSPKRGHSPQFSAHVYCGQTAGWIKMPLVMEVGLGAGHTPHYARWGPSSPYPEKGHSPHFLAHIYCGQTAGWIKMPRGMG